MASKDRAASTPGPVRALHGGRKSGQKSVITRVRTGCFTCRKRKKKCDEQKPECGNCQKTGVVCEGFPKPEPWEHRIAARRQYAGIANTMGASTTSPPYDFDLQDFGATNARSPGLDMSLVGEGLSDPPQPNYNFTSEPHLGGNLKYLFDEPSATDLGSTLMLPNDVDGFHDYQDFNQMITVNEAMDFSQDLVRRQYTNLGAQQSFIPMELPFLISGVDTNLQRRLFCHFTGVMSSLLAITVKDSNPFNAVVIPLALRDRTVMDTVLCLAGSHLSKLQQGDQDGELLMERSRLHEDAVQTQAHRVKTLKSLPPLSAASYTVSCQEVIVATSLLLCLYEVCEGTGDSKWRLHLDMARQAITAVSRNGEIPSVNGEIPSVNGHSPTATAAQEPIVTDIHPFLLEFFVYHDCIATVTCPALPNTRPIRSSANILPQDSSVVGVQDGLNDFVIRISSLREQADASPNQPDGDVVCKAVLIWQDLARWKPNVVVSTERRLIDEFYQWALFIWLFSIVYPEGKADQKVQGAVAFIAERMSNIKSGEGVMSCLLFPLSVIGSAAIRTQDRDAISAQFARLRAWSSLGNIDLTYGIVQEMWKDHDRGIPKSWDWVKQLEMRGMSFLVT